MISAQTRKQTQTAVSGFLALVSARSLHTMGLSATANPKKFQAMVRGARKHDFCFMADNTVIDEYDNIDLLGINVDNHLIKFEKHISNICKRVNKQLQVLERFRNLVSSNVKSRLHKAFVLKIFSLITVLVFYFLWCSECE